MLGRFPELSRLRPEIGPGYRTIRAADQYRIIYRVAGGDVLILRILHGRMDLRRRIREDPGE